MGFCYMENNSTLLKLIMRHEMNFFKFENQQNLSVPDWCPKFHERSDIIVRKNITSLILWEIRGITDAIVTPR